MASPRVDVDSPDDRPHADSFMLQTMMEMTQSQGAITEALQNLTRSVDKLTEKIEKIDDLRVSVGKVETQVSTLTSDLKSTKDKLDTVRNLVIGASAVITVAVTIIPLVIRFWPSTPISQSLPTNPLRSNGSSPAR